jgi:hypothetical protein
MLDPSEMNIMEQMIQTPNSDSQILAEINGKFQDIYHKLEELKFERILAEAGEK